MEVNQLGTMLAAIVSACAAAFGAWVGYLQYRDRRTAPSSAGTDSGIPVHAGTGSSPSAGDPSDRWDDDWDARLWMGRARMAVLTGATVYVALLAYLLAFGLIDDSSDESLVVSWAIGVGAVALMAATFLAIRVLRETKGRFRGAWRTARLALWLTWAPLALLVLGSILIGELTD